MLDVSKAEREFEFRGKTGLEEKVKKTIDWLIHVKNQLEVKV